MEENQNEDIAIIEGLIGRLVASQVQLVEVALSDNRAGVMSIARHLSTSGARSPVGVFINNIRAGEHKRGGEVLPFHSRRFQNLPRASAEEMARFTDIQRQWKYIYAHLGDRRINEMWQELKSVCRGYVPAQSVHELLDDGEHHVRGVRPSHCDPTDQEAAMVRETLIYAIQHPDVLEITA